MIQYLFFLGRNPNISIAELSAKLQPEAEFISLQDDKLLVDLPEEMSDPQGFLDQLGGTTKMVQIHQHSEYKSLAKNVSALALEKFKGREDKVRFAVSINSMKGGSEKTVKSCLLETKKNLKSHNISCRFINNNFQNPPTALILGENLLGKGAEFCIFESSNEWLIGITVGIQDINQYSKRDYERPERDPHLGMLPPKLAQIMINLSGAKTGQTIYDPFCGIGTMLMEGLLMDMNVIGSDVNGENVEKSHTNLDWLNDFHPYSSKFRLFNKDATKLTKDQLPEKINAIISETFLGPPVNQTPAPSKIEENQATVESLLTKFLITIRPLLPQNASVVLTLLVYRDGKDYLTLKRLHHKLEELGYQKEPLLSSELIAKLNLSVDSGKSLIYERPNQTVCREIVKLTPISA
jgi:tRNA G10  N-methylase Trm11